MAAAFESDDRKHKQYGIVVLDPHYRWAMVVGSTVDQLWLLVRAKYLVDAVGYHQVRGLPFKATELADQIRELL